MQAFAMGRARARLIKSDRGHAEPIYALPALVVLGVAALLLTAAVSPRARGVGAAALTLALGYLVVIGWHARRASQDVRVAVLAPLVFALQQAAYGLGFLAVVLRRGHSE